GSLRRILLLGVALAAVGDALLSAAMAPWQLALAFCTLVALGTAVCGPLPSTALVANWFVRRRGIALGVTVAGATIGGAIAPVVAAFLIERFGWRHALLALGLGMAAVAAPGFAGRVGEPSRAGPGPRRGPRATADGARRRRTAPLRDPRAPARSKLPAARGRIGADLHLAARLERAPRPVRGGPRHRAPGRGLRLDAGRGLLPARQARVRRRLRPGRPAPRAALRGAAARRRLARPARGPGLSRDPARGGAPRPRHRRRRAAPGRARRPLLPARGVRPGRRPRCAAHASHHRGREP